MAINDPAIERVIERLANARVPGTKNMVFRLADSGDDAAHLFVHSILEMDLDPISIPAPFLPGSKTIEIVPGTRISATDAFEMYLSRNGVKLLQLRDARTPREGVSAIIYLEVGTDAISDRVFEITPAAGLTRQQFLWMTAHIAPVLRDVLDLSHREYEDLVESRFTTTGSIVEKVMGLLVDVQVEALGVLRQGVQRVAGLVNQKMPQELWNPERRPEDFDAFMNDLGARFDERIELAFDAVQAIRPLHLSTLVEQLPDLPLPDVVARPIDALRAMLRRLLSQIDAAWNGMIALLTSVVDFMRQHRPATADSFNTLLGYLSGIWDGIVDSLTGLVESVVLALDLLAAFLKASKDPRVALQAVLEAVDQLLQAFGRVKWAQLWSHFVEETFPKVADFLTEHAPTLIVDKIATNTATVGYYFGYVVYNIAEAFFPPIKIGKIAKGIDAADGTARLVERALSA